MMTPSPAIQDNESSHYAPATPFNPMSTPHNNNYSLTALSMAAEYQSLQGDSANQNGAIMEPGVPTPITVPSASVPGMMNDSQTIMPSESVYQIPDVTFEESLENLGSFLDNEPLNTYYFTSMVSAEQPM
jgi:hypothetical protein